MHVNTLNGSFLFRFFFLSKFPQTNRCRRFGDSRVNSLHSASFLLDSAAVKWSKASAVLTFKTRRFAVDLTGTRSAAGLQRHQVTKTKAHFFSSVGAVRSVDRPTNSQPAVRPLRCGRCTWRRCLLLTSFVSAAKNSEQRFFKTCENIFLLQSLRPVSVYKTCLQCFS